MRTIRDPGLKAMQLAQLIVWGLLTWQGAKFIFAFTVLVLTGILEGTEQAISTLA